MCDLLKQVMHIEHAVMGLGSVHPDVTAVWLVQAQPHCSVRQAQQKLMAAAAAAPKSCLRRSDEWCLSTSLPAPPNWFFLH